MPSPASLPPLLGRFEEAYADFNFYTEINREEAKAIFINELRPLYKEIIPSRSLLSRICTCICPPPPEEPEEVRIVREHFQLANGAFQAPDEEALPPPPVHGVGFSNAGNNCWCNALLHLIIHNPRLRAAYLEFANHLEVHGCEEKIATQNRTLMARAQQAYYREYYAQRAAYPRAHIIDCIIPPPPAAEPQINLLPIEEEDPLCNLLRTAWKTIRAAFAALFCCFRSTPPQEQEVPLSNEQRQTLEGQFRTAIKNAYNALSEGEPPPAADAKAATLATILDMRIDAVLRTAWAQMQNDPVFITLSQSQKSEIFHPIACGAATNFVGSWLWTHRSAFIGPQPPPAPVAPAGIQPQARQHGARLREALEIYEQCYAAGIPVPEEVSQNVRLAFAFLLVNNNPNDPTLSPLSSRQEDASEILGHWIALYASHLGRPIPFATLQKETRYFAKTDEPLFPEPPPPLILPPIPSFTLGDIPITEGWTSSIPASSDPSSSKDELKASIAEWKEAARSQKAAVTDINPNEQPSKKRKVLQAHKAEWLKTMASAEREVAAWEKKTRTLEQLHQSHQRKIAEGTEEKHKYTVLQEEEEGFASPGNIVPHATLPIEIKRGVPPRLQDLFLSTLVEFPTEDSEFGAYEYSGEHLLFKELFKRHTFEEVPQNLLIPLKRQCQDAEGQDIKDTTLISIPRTLVLPKEHIENPPNENLEYELQAFIKHLGPDINSGHYIAYWKDPETNRWIEANDAKTSWISEGRALRAASGGYVFLYDLIEP